MASTTFALIELKSGVSDSSFISSVKKLDERPLYIGKCQHWIHSPTLSKKALTGAGKTMKKWDYLLVTDSSSTIPGSLSSSIDNSWSITSGVVSDTQPEAVRAAEQARRGAPVPELPQGWAPSDHSGLDASDPPPDLEASLALSAHPLGSSKEAKPTGLKEFIAAFGTKHSGPVQMFNLLSYMPGGVERYMKYIEAFQASIGIKYGGQPCFVGLGDNPDWASKSEEQGQEGGWEHLALVWYPSIWHFGKMLDDPEYADVDRKFKQGALRDNPLLCCVEVDLE